MTASARREPVVLLALIVAGLVLSGLKPADRVTWLLEVAPILVGLVVLVATYRRFPLTPLAYRLIFLLSVLLMIGGHYTYARVPAGLAVQEWLGFGRNNYDRLVHFVGGFVPAILGRELVRRQTHMRRPGWLFVFVSFGCLAGGALYEFLEWWAAAATGADADAFLATQGDPWDTQWDMFLTFLGAITALLLLSGKHERELKRLPRRG
jgi:putative membrane protein